MKHLHFLGICGTFMGGLATLAQQMGYKVTGSDQNVYPPMSHHLSAHGIEILTGYCASHLQPRPDLIVVGNSVTRGNPAVEAMLDQHIAYTSGPQWLAETVLQDRKILAVTGTHGKTTVTSILVWILETAGLNPGFLIGGIAENFDTSSRLTDSRIFVIEGDEYDTAFFDKRSKFIHYRPDVAIINNLEFDHADIFSDLAAIQRQFHHLVRTMPASGSIVVPNDDPVVDEVLTMGCWSKVQRFGQAGDWAYELVEPDGSQFRILHRRQLVAQVSWSVYGEFNVANALAAVVAAYEIGVDIQVAVKALETFQGVKRRLQQVESSKDILVFNDFAHHPTAVAATLQAIKARYPTKRVIAVIEPRSHSMRMGVHQEALRTALNDADLTFVYEPKNLGCNLSLEGDGQMVIVTHDTTDLLNKLLAEAMSGDVFVVMSNGSFDQIPTRLAKKLSNRR